MASVDWLELTVGHHSSALQYYRTFSRIKYVGVWLSGLNEIILRSHYSTTLQGIKRDGMIFCQIHISLFQSIIKRKDFMQSDRSRNRLCHCSWYLYPHELSHAFSSRPFVQVAEFFSYRFVFPSLQKWTNRKWPNWAVIAYLQKYYFAPLTSAGVDTQMSEMVTKELEIGVLVPYLISLSDNETVATCNHIRSNDKSPRSLVLRKVVYRLWWTQR